MRKYKILFILLLIILSSGWSQAQTIAMRVPDSTMVAGNMIDIPIYSDNSLTGLNVMSYLLQLTFNQSYFQPISVSVAGTISAPFGNPTVNNTVPGKITISGYGISPLSGIGKFISIRFKALKPGSIILSFSGVSSNYFNEGTPVMSYKNGNISITTPPAITVSPDNKTITKGEQQQFSVSGGATPFQWFVTNPAVANMNTSGMLTGTQPGFTKVVAQDNNGIRDTTNLIEIRAMRLSIPSNLSHLQGTDIDVPVNTTDLSGLNIYSGNFTISFNQNLLTPVGVVQTGTLLASYPVPEFNLSTPGNFSLVFYGTTPLTGSGTLIYLRFHVSSQNTGTSQFTFTNGLFNEDLLPTFTNGTFTAINLPTLTLTPNTGNLVAGETRQFTVNGGGTPPFTWSVNDTDVASISQSGLLNAKKSGVVKVTVNDSMGATASSGNFLMYDTSISMPDTVMCPETPIFYYPILIKSLPSGESVISIQGTVTYNATYLTLLDIESTGTLTQGWTYTKNPSSGQLLFVGFGTSSFNTAGIILKLKFNLNPNFIKGTSAYVNLNNVTLNEGIPLPLLDINGNIIGSGPNTAGTITGSAITCKGQQGVAYSVPTITGATGYVWTLPTDATIATGSNTNSITVNYPNTAVSGTIKVYGTNGCGNGTASPNFAVTINPLPAGAGTISGTTTVCQGQNSVSYTVSTITNATSYIWSLPTGATGTSTTKSITVNYGTSAVSGNITVKGNNSCGDGAASTLAITVNPLPASAGIISGTATVCKGQNSVSYTIPAITNATSYIWTLPTGATGTSTTSSITLNYGTSAVSGNITVKGNNTCGNGAASSLAITVNSLPVNAGTISGTATVCQGQNSVSYIVPEITNATSYIWTLPSGATGTSITNSITVDYGTSAVSGNITVKGNNSCGDSSASTLAITVNPLPASAGAISGIETVCQGKYSVSYTVPAITNATSYIWTLPAGATGTSTTNSIPVNYGTSAVSGNITVKGNNSCGDGATSTLAIMVNGTCLTHFSPNWTGSGFDHMNINIYLAKLDGVELEAGDEIGIFDGTNCVGVGTLSGTISLSNILDIAVSRDDGSGNGYTPGNAITFKLFDNSNNLEVANVPAIYDNTVPSWSTDGKFAIGATAFAELNGVTKVIQEIALNIGWNIISANIVPANLNLKDIFQTLIDAGKLKKVMDETGKTIENFGAFGGWKNNIGNLNTTKGYKVNVTATSTLSLEGTPVQLPLDINLNTGWNIISYPCFTTQDAKALFQSLIDAGKLKKVMDETGKTIENFGAFGGWKNNIGNFVPGKGYKVNVNENCVLTIPATGTKSAIVIPELITSEHFKPVFIGNGTDHMNINLVNLQASGLVAGDEIGIFDGKQCVGSATIGSEQLIAGSISIPASSNDELEETVNGFTSGHPVEFQLYRGTHAYKLNTVNVSGNESFEKNESLFTQANTNDLTGIQITDNSAQFKCFPNPFTREISIEIQNSSQIEITVEIYNMTGQRIKNLFKGTNNSNLVLKWNGTNDSGRQVAPGVYLCKVNGQSKQVIFDGGKGK